MSSPLSSLPLGVNIGPFGVDAIFTGIMVSTFLCGITVVQTWNYFSSNSVNDGWMLKSFVVILFLLDTVTAGLTVEIVHFYLVENFGNLETLETLPLCLLRAGVFEVGCNVVTVFLVELFFAHRVYLLFHRHLVIPAIIVTFAVAGLVAGIFIVVNISHDLTVAALAKPSMKIETALCNTFLALSDLTATFAMSYAFYTSRGPIKSTNSLLDKLLGFVVARGGLVTATQFLTLALYVAQPTKLNWFLMPVHFMLGKLSHITMVTILNSRESLRRPGGSLANDTGLSGRAIGTSSTPFQLRAMPDGKNGGLAGMQVHHEQVIDYDYSPAKHHA